MSTSDDIREFLISRRARITPEQVGLPAVRGQRARRVAGLRREEVALLAGISVEYYTRLERGNARGASESVVSSLVDALRLDEAERSHLLNLFRAADRTRVSQTTPPTAHVRPALQRLLDSMEGTPAFIQNNRLDIVATNTIGRALLDEIFVHSGRPANNARFVFLSDRSKLFWPDWTSAANNTVTILRTEVGKAPSDRKLSNLIGELSTRSEDFRTRWAAHDVRIHSHGTKQMHHPVVGDLQIDYEVIPLPSDHGLHLLTYAPKPGTASQDAVKLLASWAAPSADTDVDLGETAERS